MIDVLLGLSLLVASGVGLYALWWDRLNPPKVVAAPEGFMGFPSREAAERAVSRLEQGAEKRVCACGAGAPWDVFGNAKLRAGVEAIVLCCPACASIHLVSPLALGLEDPEEQSHGG